jgi:alkanesulfonate monooxygenase SsuD/methylene tetrahydromethanopterin reductase-like flavin-dependent oxidoreductase (luciferase family)
VIFTIAAKLAGGSKRTAEFAAKHGKPLLHISYAVSYECPEAQLAAFVRVNDIKTLNVAGSRGPKEPKVAGLMRKSLNAFVSIPQVIKGRT